MSFINITLKLNLVCVALITSSLAFASGFQSNRLSPSLQGTALAGAAAARNNASAMSINPATLGTVKGNQISIGGSYNLSYYGHGKAMGRLNIDPGEGPDLHFSSGANNNIQQGVIIPDAYAAFSLTPRWKVGVAVTQPWRLDNKYDENWAGSAFIVDNNITSVEITPTAAFQVNKYLSVGAAIDATYLRLHEMGEVYDQQLGGLGGEQNITGNSWALGATFGILVTPLSGTNIGLSYHTDISEKLSSTLNLSNNVDTKLDGNFYGTVGMRLPTVIDFGVSQRITHKLTGLFTAQWTRWSQLQNLTFHPDSKLPFNLDHFIIKNNWKNSWLLSLGAKYQLNPKWILRAGGAFDETPVPSDTRNPSTLGADSYTLALGAGYNLAKNLMFNFSYELTYYNPMSVDFNQKFGNKNPNFKETNISVKTKYSGVANVFGASVRWTF